MIIFLIFFFIKITSIQVSIIFKIYFLFFIGCILKLRNIMTFWSSSPIIKNINIWIADLTSFSISYFLNIKYWLSLWFISLQIVFNIHILLFLIFNLVFFNLRTNQFLKRQWLFYVISNYWTIFRIIFVLVFYH